MAAKETTDSTFNQVARRGSKLSQLTGMSQKIIGGEVATRQLLASESGSLCLFDVAAGVVYTLPEIARTEQIGMYFDFATIVTVTSNSAKVITKETTTEFILGTIFGYTTDVTEIDGFEFNGSTHVAIASNGSTTGGVIGDYYRLTAISLTQWLITGHVFCGTATPATPAATS
jgi:hypothetical protein